MTKLLDELAQEIRRVDGDHKLGARALAEALMPFIDTLLRERESAVPVAWMTHHDAPMLFPTERECAEYCADDERPIPLYAHPQCESAKAAVTDETRGTYACPICGKEYPHYHPEDTSRVNWHSDYRKVFEDIISANVRLYKDGVSIAPTNYSHESKLTVAGIAGHWFAYGAEDARSFGRESKGTDSAAWSEFASNGDGYAYAWMDSLWSLFKQTVVALKGREAVAPMLASASKAGSAHLNENPVAMARVFCEAIIANQYQDPARKGHLCVEVEPLLKAINAQRDAGITKASARVPDGWQLVPVDPTAEMIDQGTAQHECEQGDPWYSSPSLSDGDCIAIYKAMIAASPKPETE